MQTETVEIAIIGAGPAGLMAAETLSAAGFSPVLYEAMPTPARKFLMAGKSGLNLTHSEPLGPFLSRYAAAEPHIRYALDLLSPSELRSWADDLGAETFVGSSGRIFPSAMKASPLLRAWLTRLSARGVTLKPRHKWVGWAKNETHLFETPSGPLAVAAKASIFALGGSSWPKLGADGSWTKPFSAKDISLSPFKPSNCGFDIGWSQYFIDKYAGAPVKGCQLSTGKNTIKGDFVITTNGVEGSAVYSLSSVIRDQLSIEKEAILSLDLTPDRPIEKLVAALSKTRGKKSFATHLKRATGLIGVKAGLLREFTTPEQLSRPESTAKAIKKVRIPVLRARPIEEAISVAGGVDFEALTPSLMLITKPGIFCAGEMLNWEAPTGGYLLTACIAQGKQAALGVEKYLKAAS